MCPSNGNNHAQLPIVTGITGFDNYNLEDQTRFYSMALPRPTSELGNDWLDWVENNCKMFLDIKKMWVMD